MAGHKKPSVSKSKAETWRVAEGGREVTNSPSVILRTLGTLKNKKTLLTLLHRGYQSGSTILLEFGKQHLEIGKPADWPQKENEIRVIFKDGGRLWNYFTVQVASSKGDVLRTTIPRELFRLQRRAHFRVSVPPGCEADFKHKKEWYTAVQINDISAGGMQICSKKKLPLASGDTISDIVLMLSGSDISGEQSALRAGLMLQIDRGRVARTTEEESTFCYGIDFRHSQNEEQLLLRYVRQRELELLRRGVVD